MENSLGYNNSVGVSENEPSLLLLNDDCLTQIFQRLELLDFVSLSKTCVRLKNVAGDTFVRKFKSIVISGEGIDYTLYSGVKVTKQQFGDALSLIGGHVLSIEIFDGSNLILETIMDNCKNVKSLALFCSKCSLNMSPRLQEFRSLKELTVYECEISKKKLRQIFINNPGIESLTYDWAYKGFMKLLRLLPKLRRLHVDSIEGLSLNKVPNIFHLKDLTEFKFRSDDNCNQFLIELATKLKLVKLDFHCNTNDETFNIIKLFQNLEDLSIGNMMRSCSLPVATVFPPNLKRISFYNITLTYTTLASQVKEHKLLEEIHLCDKDIVVGPYDVDEKIYGIVNALGRELKQRTLKIIYSINGGWENDEGKYFYDSPHLKIINKCCKKEQQKFSKVCSLKETSFLLFSND